MDEGIRPLPAVPESRSDRSRRGGRAQPDRRIAGRHRGEPQPVRQQGRGAVPPLPSRIHRPGLEPPHEPHRQAQARHPGHHVYPLPLLPRRQAHAQESVQQSRHPPQHHCQDRYPQHHDPRDRRGEVRGRSARLHPRRHGGQRHRKSEEGQPGAPSGHVPTVRGRDHHHLHRAHDVHVGELQEGSGRAVEAEGCGDPPHAGHCNSSGEHAAGCLAGE
mmetsp:Transcript_15889/g.45680  ORF Transcript_15889/g.45680 Transcript_15889/m.45680 type:complete len:217 (+) Transcript_15889:728-1378(+)